MPTLKIVCLNVWIGGLLLEPMMTFLKQEAADVYLLQEVFAGEDPKYSAQYRTFDALKAELQLPYSHFAPAFMEVVGGVEIPQGNAILSRFPISDEKVTYFDVPFGVRKNEWNAYHVSPRNVQHVTITADTKRIHLFNTQGIWGEDGRDNPRRIEMAKSILNEVGDHQPTILAGDFNVQPDTQTISLIEQKLTNVFKNELPTTFNLKRKDLVKLPGFATAVVDMVFLSRDIRLRSHSCPSVDVSDHLPLIVECEIE